MLRYKNSLLERILLEKGTTDYPWYGFSNLTSTGIDVQAELRAKTGSPSLGPTHAPQGMAQPPTVQRAIMNRHHQARRSNSNIAPKLETGLSVGHPGPMGNPSPQSRPTPSSHHSSPNSASPGFSQQGVMTPPGSEIQQQHQAQLHQQRAQHPLKQHAANGLPRPAGANGVSMKGQGSSGTGVMGGPTTAYYPSPFQNHIEQLGKLTPPSPLLPVSFNGTPGPSFNSVNLEQEYDAQPEMVDDQDTPEPAGPGPYPAPFGAQLPPMNTQQRPQHTTTAGEHVPGFNSMTQQLLDPYDPMLDMDPFGLSASMHFPTQFTFDTSSMR